MNPDLAMGDDLLKKTGAGNLFMVFGEPDIDVRPAADGQLAGRDPRRRRLRPDDRRDPHRPRTDDIACWFIDTDYNGESFFVRHAYFTGADEPYDKLAARAPGRDRRGRLGSRSTPTVSRPFPTPRSGKIAVKVINHYGDEVLKVCDL